LSANALARLSSSSAASSPARSAQGTSSPWTGASGRSCSSLSLEVEVQHSSLAQIATPSSELTRTLEGCERERRKVDQERQGYEALQAVEARREERLKGLKRLNQVRSELAEELTRKESALSAFPDLDSQMHSSRRGIENMDRVTISCRRERDSLIARHAQIKQRQEQIETARTRRFLQAFLGVSHAASH
jgi:hypothetical protein